MKKEERRGVGKKDGVKKRWQMKGIKISRNGVRKEG